MRNNFVVISFQKKIFFLVYEENIYFDRPHPFILLFGILLVSLEIKSELYQKQMR